MQKTDTTNNVKVTHRKVQSSTTLNRKYVQRPRMSSDMVAVPVRRSPKISRFKTEEVLMEADEIIRDETPMQEFQPHPVQVSARQQMSLRNRSVTEKSTHRLTAKEMKDQAIRQALASAATEEMNEPKKQKKAFKQLRFGVGRVLLALTCAAIAVFAIVYFVNLSTPDISLKVAAMQSGINASYPSYVPRDYALSSITSENKTMTLDFKNTKADGGFTITEEASSWDSNALLNNYVKDAFGENYSTVKEQGLTIFISNGNATWTNGGVMYKIASRGESLTQKQVISIATSL